MLLRVSLRRAFIEAAAIRYDADARAMRAL